MPETRTLTPDLARTLYFGIEDRDARAFLDFLIDHPGEQFTSEQVQQDLSFPEHKQVALAAYAIGELAGSLGLSRPWTEGQKGYVMSARQASLFAEARASSTGGG